MTPKECANKVLETVYEAGLDSDGPSTTRILLEYHLTQTIIDAKKAADTAATQWVREQVLAEVPSPKKVRSYRGTYYISGWYDLQNILRDMWKAEDEKK